MGKTTAVILAAGSGSRMGKSVPKQFIVLEGIPLVRYSIDVFSCCEYISDIIVVSHPDYMVEMEKIIADIMCAKPIRLVQGGETRQISSLIGIESCPPGAEYVLIHDSARPFVSHKIIKDVMDAAIKKCAAGPVIDTCDTMVECEGNLISGIPERKKLKRMQTPQGFQMDVIINAHRLAAEAGKTDISDDCGLVLLSGIEVITVPGDVENIKITSKLDIGTAKAILAGRPRKKN